MSESDEKTIKAEAPVAAPKAPNAPKDDDALEVTVIQLGELRAESRLFSANSVASLKVTAGKGKIRRMDVPIRSLEMGEVEKAVGEPPTPPTRRAVVEPGSDMAREFNMPAGGKVVIHDTAHPDYVRLKGAHEERTGWATLALGINAPLYLADGREAKLVDEKIQVLKSLGLSASHFVQLAQEIAALTALKAKEASDFFAAEPG